MVLHLQARADKDDPEMEVQTKYQLTLFLEHSYCMFTQYLSQLKSLLGSGYLFAE